MSGKSQRRRKTLASGTGVAIAIFAALAATGLSLTGPLKPATLDEATTAEAPKMTDWREIARQALDKEKLSFDHKSEEIMKEPKSFLKKLYML